MFNTKVRKYLMLTSNDSPDQYFSVQGSFSGVAQCPTNPDKESFISCMVSINIEHGKITRIRVSSVGTPPLIAAGNLAASRARGLTPAEFLPFCEESFICEGLDLTPEIYKTQGVWALYKAAAEALSTCND